MEKQNNTHLKLSKAELDLISRTIEEDVRNALMQHDERMKRFNRYYKYWRSRIGMLAKAAKSNFKVPLIVWTLLARWAKEVDALLGDDAEIVAKPVGPMDEKNVTKISRYMTWRFFSYMGATLQLIKLKFYKLLFGRAFAHRPYRLEKDDSGEVIYDGPDFKTIWPDDFIVPAEDACSLHEFSWVTHKVKLTLGDLRKGERDGLYFGITEMFKELYQTSQTAPQRDHENDADRMTRQRDRYEGTERDYTLSRKESLTGWFYYGYWRLPKNPNESPAIDDFDNREMDAIPVKVCVLPDMAYRVIGIQNLNDLYPKMRNKRPFVEEALTEDGSYWCPGLGEYLEDLQVEMSVNHNLMTDAGELSVNPMGAYKPASGFAPKKLRAEPGLMIPSDDPGNDLKFFELRPNLNFSVMQFQQLMAMAERITGITDMNLGRQADRPNQPKTARQTLAFLDEGNSRLSLDNRVAREYARRMFTDIWELDTVFADEETFFRVTEEKAQGLFEVAKGGATITREERAGRMDFDIQFATSIHSKEAKKERELQLFGLFMQLPIFQQNPSAQYLACDDVLKSHGKPGMSRYMMKPAEADYPIEPRDEWTLMLQGEDVKVHPNDRDEWHIEEHEADLRRHQALPPEKQDDDAIQKMISHLLAQREQHAEKQRQAAMAQMFAQGVEGLLGVNSTELMNRQLAEEEMPVEEQMGGGLPPEMMQMIDQGGGEF